MTLPAALLLIFSAGVHAAWNLLGKRENPSPAFMLVANTLGCLCLLPVLFLVEGGLREVVSLARLVWPQLVITGITQALYYTALARAYRAGDLSVVYPLARATPVLFVALLTRWLGLGEPIGPLAVLGMLLVVAGCLILPIPGFAAFHWRNYTQRACLWALAAAVGMAGYSLVDSQAILRLRPAVESAQVTTVTALYALLEGLSASLCLALVILPRRSGRRDLTGIRANGWRQAALVGIGIYLAYTLVLLAMGLVTNVSYVVAFRQLSIPLGALLGVTVLKEPPHLPKFIGVGMVFAGLILVGLG